MLLRFALRNGALLSRTKPFIEQIEHSALYHRSNFSIRHFSKQSDSNKLTKEDEWTEQDEAAFRADFQADIQRVEEGALDEKPEAEIEAKEEESPQDYEGAGLDDGNEGSTADSEEDGEEKYDPLSSLSPAARALYIETKSQIRPKADYVADLSRQTRSTISDPSTDETSTAKAFDPVLDSFHVPMVDIKKHVDDADHDAYPLPMSQPGTQGHGYRPLPYAYVARRAGSMIDVFKHTVLTQLIEAHQTAYGESWTFIDFKAGPVAINIERSIHRPWGIDAAFEYGKWWARLGRKYSQSTRHALVPFMHVTRLVNSRAQDHISPVDADGLPGRLDRGFPLYPGTPAIVRNMMRGRDRAIFFEPDRGYRRHIIDYFNNDDPTFIPELQPMRYQARDDIQISQELQEEIDEDIREEQEEDEEEAEDALRERDEFAEEFGEEAAEAQEKEFSAVEEFEAQRAAQEAVALEAQLRTNDRAASEFDVNAEVEAVELAMLNAEKVDDSLVVTKAEAREAGREIVASMDELRTRAEAIEDEHTKQDFLRAVNVLEAKRLEAVGVTRAELEQTEEGEEEEEKNVDRVLFYHGTDEVVKTFDVAQELDDTPELTPEVLVEQWFENEDEVFPDQKSWPVDPVEDSKDDPSLKDARIRVYPFDVYSDNNSFDVIGALAQPTTAHGLLHIDLTTHDRFEGFQQKMDKLGKEILPKFSKQFPHATIMCSIPMYGGVLPYDHARHFVKLGYKDVMYTSRVCQAYLEQGMYDDLMPEFAEEEDEDRADEDEDEIDEDEDVDENEDIEADEDEEVEAEQDEDVEQDENLERTEEDVDEDELEARDYDEEVDVEEDEDQLLDQEADAKALEEEREAELDLVDWDPDERDEEGESKLFTPGGGQALIEDLEPWGVAVIIARPPLGFWSRAEDVADTIDDADSKIGRFDVAEFGEDEADEILWRADNTDELARREVNRLVTTVKAQPEQAWLTKHWSTNPHDDHAFEQDWDVPLKQTQTAKTINMHQLKSRFESALQDEQTDVSVPKYYNEAKLWHDLTKGPDMRVANHKRMLDNTKRRSILTQPLNERKAKLMEERLVNPQAQELAKATKIQTNEAKALQAWKNAVKAAKQQHAS